MLSIKKERFPLQFHEISFYGKDIRPGHISDELKRIRSFIETFYTRMIDELLSLINCHDKIVLFGYGPSLRGVQYGTVQPM